MRQARATTAHRVGSATGIRNWRIHRDFSVVFDAAGLFCGGIGRHKGGMAKLYFHYASMNAGKSTLLLQASYNYQERGMRTVILTAALDSRAGVGRVASRIGLQAEAIPFGANDDLHALVEAMHRSEEHTSELQSLMRISYAVFCLKKKK